MRYYKVVVYRIPVCDESTSPHTSYIAAKDDEDYKKQLKDALWRAEDYSITELTFEQYNDILNAENIAREYRATQKYMYLYW